MNHLSTEKSPYLLQHANNPVDWYPWGPEAFEKARREDKPIFLSVGYSTCHWCHVMERESFENDQIAQVLNADFIAIKVDREERPDVDRIYMNFVQASTGGGGWPMSVFLTPDLKPFFGGTYFPPGTQYGRPGFMAVLHSLAGAWHKGRGKIEESAAGVVEQLKQYAEPRKSPAAALDYTILDSAFQYYRRAFDSVHGGFGGAPKFPRPSVFNFLFRYWKHTQNDEALDMSLKTLRAMAAGGMNDQLGGGFHRYSVDERWFVPHFEKMLYDQAQLAISYVEAFQITGEALYAGIARDTLDYVLRDMTDPQGGFYSAEDADSVIDPAHPHEKGEGAFYVWTRQEIDRLLGHPAASKFAERYGVKAEGNVLQDPHGEFTGKNILYLARPEAGPRLPQWVQILLKERGQRVRPHLDDKILTAWNGLMISAFAKAAQVLDEERYATAARRAASFIVNRMYDRTDGTLLRRYRAGDAAIPGFLDDYAFFVQALLDLYETEFQVADIELAMSLTKTMIRLFEDRENGGFYSTAEGDQSLLMRVKDDYDGAEPSANSIALLNLPRLARLTNDSDFANAAGRTLTALGSRISNQPVAVPQMLVALDRYLSPNRQVIIVGERNNETTRQFLKKLRAIFLPTTTVLLVDSEAARPALSRLAPEVTEMKQIEGQTTVYVCENFVCKLPVTDLSEFASLLQ